MNKKGFTLIELLATITLLSLIVVLVYPKITEQVEKKQKDVDEAKLKLIYSATKDYVLANSDIYLTGSTYCVSLDKLEDENYVSFDTSDIKKRGVQITIGDNNKYSYDMKEKCE